MASRARMETDTPFIFYSFIYISQCPQLRRSSSKRGNIWSPSTESHADGRPTYAVQWGMAWFPMGIVDDTAITTLVPCNL